MNVNAFQQNTIHPPAVSSSSPQLICILRQNDAVCLLGRSWGEHWQVENLLGFTVSLILTVQT